MKKIENSYKDLANYFGVGMTEFWRFWDSLPYRTRIEYLSTPLDR